MSVYYCESLRSRDKLAILFAINRYSQLKPDQWYFPFSKKKVHYSSEATPASHGDIRKLLLPVERILPNEFNWVTISILGVISLVPRHSG